MLLHGVKDTEFDIFHGDTLLNEWDMMREQNPAKKASFEAIVASHGDQAREQPRRFDVILTANRHPWTRISRTAFLRIRNFVQKTLHSRSFVSIRG